MLAGQSFSLPSSEIFAYSNNGFTTKKKRKPAGTPDPDAEVEYLSSEMLMESGRYVCEICNQSFQREQNLQMHKRRHKVPWKLLKREREAVIRKRVYVCPVPSCLHHDPCHALGDLVGIKKHFRRKHGNQKQWVCEKCCKGYAVQSDYKAHIKICGTRGHSCDCGRVFSRVEAFIEHQDTCKACMTNYVQLASSPTGEFLHSSLTPLGFMRDSNFSKNPADTGISMEKKLGGSAYEGVKNNGVTNFCHNLELELFTSNSSPSGINLSSSPASERNHSSQAVGGFIHEQESEGKYSICCYNFLENSFMLGFDTGELPSEASRLRDEARELSRIAMEQKALAEEKRQQANCLVGMARQEMAKARKIREQALAEFNAAQALKECATRKNINSNVVQITCNTCQNEFQTLSQEASYGEAFSTAKNSSISSAILEGHYGNTTLMLWARSP